jgi:Uma2 family endonuclease
MGLAGWPVLVKKCMTKKEHQRNLRRIAKAIADSNVQLRKAGIQVQDSQIPIQTNQRNLPAAQSGRVKTDNRPSASI